MRNRLLSLYFGELELRRLGWGVGGNEEISLFDPIALVICASLLVDVPSAESIRLALVDPVEKASYSTLVRNGLWYCRFQSGRLVRGR